MNVFTSRFGTWFFATRPKTLIAAFIPVLCGTALGYQNFLKANHLPLKLHLAFFALLSAICIQIGTNFINDALDFIKGADTKERIGPKRISQSGVVPAKKVLSAGFFALALSALFGLPLVQAAGTPILILGLLSLICAYGYTGGPFPIAYIGLGEIFVILFFGFGAVLGTFFLQASAINLNSLILSSQIGLLSAVIIAINNLRDYETDRIAQKWTLAARFGPVFGKYLLHVFYFIFFVLSFYWLTHDLAALFYCSLAVLPFCVFILYSIHRNKPAQKYNKYLGLSAFSELVFGILIAVVLFL